MKKIKVTFLAICFAMTVMMLTACGSKDNTGDKSSTSGMETTQSIDVYKRQKLDTVAKALNISLKNHHRAVDDAGATAEIRCV